MTMHDMIDRLREDPGHRTLGQLLQERQWAVEEIARLRDQIAQIRLRQSARLAAGEPKIGRDRVDESDALPDPLRLIRLRDLRKLIGLSNSVIYKMMNEGSFPRSLHLGPRTVAWKMSDIMAWQKSLEP